MHISKNTIQAGFSLIELMIVVGIIGILATLAIPRFTEFQAKASMSEARNTLHHIYTLQQAYHLDNGNYHRFNFFVGANLEATDATPYGNCSIAQLGFSMEPCNNLLPRYAYRTGVADSTDFISRAQSGKDEYNRICPGKGDHAFYVSANRNIIFSNIVQNGTLPDGQPASCAHP